MKNENIPIWYKVAFYEWFHHKTKELKGKQNNNPRIIQMLGTCKLSHNLTDEIPWCSAFINWCLSRCNIKGTDNALAYSWTNWGMKLTSDKWKRGAVVIFEFTKLKFHVAFLDSFTKDTVTVIGGNQKNKVCFETYSRKNVLDVRYPTLKMIAMSKPPDNYRDYLNE